MPYRPVTIERFGGLNLSADAGDLGFNAASDLLNVEFTPLGTVHARVGWAKLNATTGAARYQSMGWNGAYILAGNTSAFDVISSTGTRQSTTAMDASYMEFANFGTPSTSYTYFTAPLDTTTTIRRLSGSTVTAPAGMPSAYTVCVQNPDNRLVAGNILGTSINRVKFSNAGDATTWGTNDYVDITPGDGEWVTRVVSWRNLVFAFKFTKFAVFYGNSTDSTGATEFNYRMVTGACPGTACQAGTGVVAADDAVYFTNDTGVYRTTGGVPECISAPVSAFFNGVGPTTASSYLSSLPTISGNVYGMAYAKGRLYISTALGSSTTNSHILVYDTVGRWWSVYSANASALAMMSVSGTTTFLHQKSTDEGLVFAYSSGTNDIGMFSQSYITDGGSAMSSYYVSGYSDLGAPQDKVVRQMEATLRGIRGSTNSSSFQLLADYGSSTGTAKTVTTTSSPVTSVNRNALRGREFAFKVSATAGPWALDRVTLNVREAKSSGTDS